MKIRCDVCDVDEATVFCVSDEAAICAACDHRVHHANKLASKHRRFSLLRPSSAKQFPLCDVCQEKRAFLFCQQDRAMLCRDCDVPIHGANELTKKHDRFLLTGVKLSATSDLYTPSKPALTVGDPSFASDLKPKPVLKKPVSVPESVSASSAMLNLESGSKTSSNIPHAVPLSKDGEENWIANEGGGSSSSFSEYLIETLPGWHVEDFLESSPAPFGFCKTDETILPLMDDELENSLNVFWVPQTASSQRPQETMSGLNMLTEPEEWNVKVNRGWIDDGFTVPQINPASSGFKRSRPFW